MDLASIGWGPDLQAAFETRERPGEVPGRVSEEHRGAFRVWTAHGERAAQASGRLVYRAAGPENLPAVGDWVAVVPGEGGAPGTIGEVLPRRTLLARRSPERAVRAQVIAANVDVVWVVASANRDFNVRRIERTLALVAESGAQAVVVLSKGDLVAPADRARLAAEARAVAPGADVVALSAHTGEGLDALVHRLRPARTAALVGSSGAGKSTLVNRLLEREAQATTPVRADDDRGRHATTARRLFRLPGGALLVDTPGLREVGLLEAGDGGALASVFPELEALAARCRFRDCAHEAEPGCAVRAALEDGTLDPDRLASHRKLEREARHAEERRTAAGRHARRERHRRFTRTLRQRPRKPGR